MANFRKPRPETIVESTGIQENQPVKIEPSNVEQESNSLSPQQLIELIKNPETVQTLRQIIGDTIKSEEPGEKLKESRRKYGFELDGVTIRKSEPRKYKYRILMDNAVEKVVMKCDTIGRPISDINHNTGKRINEHNLKIVFHDGSEMKMDLTEFLQRSYYGGEGRDGEYVQYDDIKVLADGTRDFTFRTEKFGVFTINSRYIG